MKISNLINIVDLLPREPAQPSSIFDILPVPKNSIASVLIDRMNILNSLYSIQLDMSGKSEEDSGLGYEEYIQWDMPQIKEKAEEITTGLTTNDEKMYAIEQWVQDNVTYVSDERNYGQPEYWAYPIETLSKMSGDCIAVFEEIFVKNGVKKVGDLEIGDEVLSYDFNTQTFVYKPIVKMWEKGYLPAKRVHFRNGNTAVLTENHPMLSRVNQQGKSRYEKLYLKDIDLTRWWTRKVPVATRIPYEIKDIEWLTEELCFVLGHYLAEGWFSGGKVQTSGYDIPGKIDVILEKHHIPFSTGKNNNGVPTINFLKSDFKEFLKIQKSSSFDIHMEEWLFALPENKLMAILDGHKLGDGHNSEYPDNRGYASNKKYVHSTSSYRFVHDLQRMALQLGFSFHTWKQVFHGGAGDKRDGKHPIWRLTYNPNSVFLRSHGYENLSEVSIKKIESLPLLEMRDFEIADTHNFICKNGQLYHNCEDGAFLIHSLALAAGVEESRVRTYAGYVYDPNSNVPAGHGWVAYQREYDDAWITMDWCYWPKDEELTERGTMSADNRYIDDFWYIEGDKTVETPFANKVRMAKMTKGLKVNLIA